MAKYRKRKYAKRYRRKTYRKYTKKAKSSSLRSVVRKEIHRMAENKINQSESTTYFFTQPIVTGQAYNLLPTINQGTGSSNRIGNKIRVLKFSIKLLFYTFIQAPGTVPTYVDLYIFKYKNYSQALGSLPANAMNEFLDVNNSSGAYSGISTDYLRTINTDQFTLLYKKRMQMFNANNSVNTIAITSSIPCSRNISIDLTKHLKKNLVYDDADNKCSNDQMFIAVGSTQVDGSVLLGNIGTYQFLSEFKYEDM